MSEARATEDVLVVSISEQGEFMRTKCSLTSGSSVAFTLDREQKIAQIHVADADRFLRNRVPPPASFYRATYSPSIDMAYIEIVPIHDGGIASTDGCFELPMATIVNVDLDASSRVLGLEFDGASAALPRAFLDTATLLD